jgi:hypothetical protein
MHGQQNIKSKYMQIYGISFMHSYKQSGRWQDVLDTRPAALPKRNVRSHTEVPHWRLFNRGD